MSEKERTYQKPSLMTSVDYDIDRLIKSINQLTKDNEELNSALESKFSEIKVIKKMLLNERLRAIETESIIRGHETKGKEDDSNSWLGTYADAVSLILAFFVIMYSMMTLDSAKFNEASDGIRQAFTSQESTTNLMATVESLESELNQISPKYGFVVNRDGNNIRVTLHVSGLFPLGKATLRNEQSEVLREIAKKLKKHQIIRPFTVEVQGHTDDLPIHNKEFEDNWELSALRATSTLKYLINNGIDSKRAKASGLAETVPLPRKENEDIRLHRSKNRRIEILIYPTL